jgi:hypothetical protein
MIIGGQSNNRLTLPQRTPPIRNLSQSHIKILRCLICNRRGEGRKSLGVPRLRTGAILTQRFNPADGPKVVTARFPGLCAGFQFPLVRGWKLPK